MEHKLKILSKYYAALLQGEKTFEVRKDDRPFSCGDTLLLQECVTPYGCDYTGREMTVEVTYILRDSEYVKDGYCIMGIKIISTNKSRYYGNKPSRDSVLFAKADVQRWISVGEALPIIGRRVLVYTPNWINIDEEYQVAHLDETYGCGIQFVTYDDVKLPTVTHWQPLPEPPMIE